MKVSTRRLDLIPASLTLLAAEIEGRESLGRLLRAEVPENWPPDLYDREALEHSVECLQTNCDAAGWTFWYVILRERSTGGPVVIGIGGFKGKPSASGVVEIGYSVLEQFQRVGYATETVEALLEWAFSHHTVQHIIAETYPRLASSIRVLEKNGFQLMGVGSEEHVMRFGVARPPE